MKKKIFVLASALLALVLMLGACSSVKEIKSTEEEARVVGMCGEHEIRYEELRYLTMNYKLELEAKYGEGIFDTAATGEQYEDELMTLVSEALIKNYALIELCDTKDIKISDKTSKKQVQEYVEESVEQCGDMDAYKAYLADNYMTDWVFRLNTAILGCQQRYYEVLAEEQDEQAYDAVMAGEGIIRCMSIFVRNDEGESVEANRKAAQTVRDAVAAGASVEDYIGTKYNQDTSTCDYYFMRGYFVEEYENAAFALEVGEVSEVVEVDNGFYVIQRMEPEDWYFESNLDSLKTMYHLCTMENETNRIAETLSFDLNEIGEQITLWSMQ